MKSFLRRFRGEPKTWDALFDPKLIQSPEGEFYHLIPLLSRKELDLFNVTGSVAVGRAAGAQVVVVARSSTGLSLPAMEADTRKALLADIRAHADHALVQMWQEPGHEVSLAMGVCQMSPYRASYRNQDGRLALECADVTLAEGLMAERLGR